MTAAGSGRFVAKFVFEFEGVDAREAAFDLFDNVGVRQLLERFKAHGPGIVELFALVVELLFLWNIHLIFHTASLAPKGGGRKRKIWRTVETAATA